MANFKRKRCRRVVKCKLCTPHRWKGNSRERMKRGDMKRDDPRCRKEEDDGRD